MAYYGKSTKRAYSLIPEGAYEATVYSCEEKMTKAEQPYIQFSFQIRSDAKQAYGGRIINKSFWQGQDGEYPNDKIGAYAAVLGIPEDTDFMLRDLVGRYCIVNVGHYDAKDGTKKDCVKYITESVLGEPAFGTLNPEDIPF